MYTIKLTRKAEKGYNDLFLEDYRKKVNELVPVLEINPYPARMYDMIKLADNTYRIRLGRVRVQYTVFEEEKVILVHKIELRDDSTYKK